MPGSVHNFLLHVYVMFAYYGSNGSACAPYHYLCSFAVSAQFHTP